MTCNVGGADRGVRLVVGCVFVAFSLLVNLPGYWEFAPFLVGAVMLATALVRYCPVNAALKLDTRRP